jgi:hypothetical protein
MFYDSNSFWKGFLISLVTFGTIQYILSKNISYKDKRQYWKRVNISTSFIHAIISSIMSIYWFGEKKTNQILRIFFNLV